MRRAALAALLAAGFTLLPPTPALAATFRGEVVMGTAGAALPAGLRVTVVEIAASGDMGSPQHLPVQPDGSYTFEGDPSLEYLIGTIHGGVTYSLVAEPGELPDRDLRIYEATSDVSAVEIASDTLTIVPSDGSDVLEVLQLLRFRNPTDRTYIGEAPQEGVLKLPVPESVFDLAPATEENNAGLTTTPQGLMTNLPLQPGEMTVPYLYKVRVPRSGWQLRREVFYPTDHSDLLIGEGLRLNAGPGYEFAEQADLGGARYDRYRSEGLLPGAVIAADVGFVASTGDSGLWAGAVAILVLVTLAALAGAVAVRRRRRARAGAEGARTPAAGMTPAQPGPSRQELIDQVALLDESFDAGGLERSEYETQRSKLLADLRAASP